MKPSSLRTFVFLLCGLTLSFVAVAEAAHPIPPAHPPEWYRCHILAIDENGNALWPTITISGPDQDRHYRGSYAKAPLEGEDTRKARVDSVALRRAVETHLKPKVPPYSEGMVTALKGRACLVTYLAAMFQAAAQSGDDEVVIYVHGGLNDIKGAIAKSALLADVLADEHKYFIGICWNSNLMPTYNQHLLSIREGLHQSGKALVTAPAMLLADVGGAVVRLPLNLANFLYQDAYTTNPKIYSRTKLANARFTQMIQGQSDRKKTPLDGITVFSGGDERSETQEWLVDFGRWFLTVPIKFSTTVALDTLGVQPWKNMVRRTRTMFERESEFIPDLTYDDATELARYQGDLIVPAKLIDQLNFTGRKGAMWHFCDQLQQYLTTRNQAGEPKVTVIGHSMGAIVTCEMLERFHRLPVDNVVLMAAACSINDFKVKIIPYLEEQNLRADFASKAPAAAAAYAPFIKTKLYNLCLNDTGEHLEPNPGQLDLVQRGSLLTWVDTLYQNPESENDRTLGRWVNAVLATDDIPSGVLNRITIKGFGLDRRRRRDSPVYTATPSRTNVIDEPTKHGEFSRYQEKEKKRASNFRFWDPKFREPEPTADVAPR